MLTNKIHPHPKQDQGAEIIVMHPEIASWSKPGTVSISKVKEIKPATMPEQPTGYLRPKKHDYL